MSEIAHVRCRQYSGTVFGAHGYRTVSFTLSSSLRDLPYYTLFMATVSQSPPEAASSSDYEAIFDNALKAYKKKTGNDLASDPLLRRLEACNSPDSVISLLKDQIPAFDKSGSSDEKLTKWVNPVVNVLYNFAATIGGAVSLVSLGILGTFIRSQVYFLGIPTSGSDFHGHCLSSLGEFRSDPHCTLL